MSSGEHGSSVPNTSHHNGIPGERKSLILAEEVRDAPTPRRSIPKSSSAKQLFDKSSLSTVIIDNLGHKHSGSSNNNLNAMPISPLVTQTQSASDSDGGHSNATTALVPTNRMPRNESSTSVNVADVELQISRRPSILLHELLSTRRPSAVMATLRAPAYTPNNTRPRIMGSLQEDPDNFSAPSSNGSGPGGPTNQLAVESRRKNRRVGDDALSTALSALYCKVLVLLGVAFPVTELITSKIPTHIYQGFYVFLYIGSLAFVVFVYAVHMKSRALFNILKTFHEKANNIHIKRRTQQLGSFYLRVGAIAFGIGTMVYSGLEFGQFFELSGHPGCDNIFIALTPACRMALAIIQIQFIFLNTTELDIGRHKVVARFGLMHMIATNLCEWLYVLVEETKHEIYHIMHTTTKSMPMIQLATDAHNITGLNASSVPLSISKRSDTGAYVSCQRTNIMGTLVQDSSPFLFPCTIEYSLICAVILYEMWKKVKSIPDIQRSRSNSQKPHVRSAYHFSVDCSGAHKGMFAGILVTVLTIIALIMYFVLQKQEGYSDVAVLEMTICEIIMYSLTILAVIIAMIKIRDLKYLKGNDEHEHSMELDCTLLVLAQTGVYLYSMFSMMGSFYAIWRGDQGGREGLAAEALAMLQASVQTLFILNACKRKCKGAQQQREKPGRELVTFLLIANMSIWFINALVKGHASYRTSHNDFFGTWAWTIIVHVSMPLAIFYRFHSTICLFEVWKATYKAKNHDQGHH
ncbi:unnamed protein product [Hermetia illucens]|uniref:Otopetrin n=2 Tax=Hermetia illucens TaxID=343691 RepID=A0A7R8V183_HERIL|nr:unnamed protein product [Hermetia illucens]